MKLVKALPFVAFLALACSVESKVKDAAVQAARDRLEKKVRAEAEEKIAGKAPLVKIYVRTIAQQSEFEVEETTITPPTATALVKVRSFPKPVRSALVDILARLAPSKENAFNVPDALKDTLKAMNMSPDERTETKERIELRDQDGWQALPDK